MYLPIFRPGQTQIYLCSHITYLDARNLKISYYTVPVKCKGADQPAKICIDGVFFFGNLYNFS